MGGWHSSFRSGPGGRKNRFRGDHHCKRRERVSLFFDLFPPGSDREIGSAGKDGTEYTQTVTGGSASGSFRDLPAGTYRLFVRNGEKLSELPDDPENPEDYLLDGVVNLYQADETSFGTSSGTGFALGYPGASMELNPISWTFSRADVPLLEDALKGSGFLALYVDQDLTLRVTSDHVIEISRDGGLTSWKAETCETIDGEDFSV